MIHSEHCTVDPKHKLNPTLWTLSLFIIALSVFLLLFFLFLNNVLFLNTNNKEYLLVTQNQLTYFDVFRPVKKVMGVRKSLVRTDGFLRRKSEGKSFRKQRIAVGKG